MSKAKRNWESVFAAHPKINQIFVGTNADGKSQPFLKRGDAANFAGDPNKVETVGRKVEKAEAVKQPAKKTTTKKTPAKKGKTATKKTPAKKVETATKEAEPTPDPATTDNKPPATNAGGEDI